MPGNFGNNSFSPSEIEDLLECIYGLSGSNGEGTGDYFEGYLGFTTQDLYPEEFEFLSEHQDVIGSLKSLCDEFGANEALLAFIQETLAELMNSDDPHEENIRGSFILKIFKNKVDLTVEEEAWWENNLEDLESPPLFGPWISCESFNFNDVITPGGDLISTSSIRLDLKWKENNQVIRAVPLVLEFTVPYSMDDDLAAACASDAVNWAADLFYYFWGGNPPSATDDLIRTSYLTMVDRVVSESGCAGNMEVELGIDPIDPAVPGPVYRANFFSYYWRCGGF